MSLCNLLRPETEFGIPGAVVNALPSSKQEQGGWMSDRRTGPKIRRLDMGRRFLCHSSLSRMKTSLEDAYQWVAQFLISISKILSPTPQQKH